MNIINYLQTFFNDNSKPINKFIKILIIGPEYSGKKTFMNNIYYNFLEIDVLLDHYNILYKNTCFQIWYTGYNIIQSVILSYFKDYPPDLCLLFVKNYTNPNEFEKYNNMADCLSNSSKVVIIDTKLQGFDSSSIEGYCVKRNIFNIKIDVQNDTQKLLDILLVLV